MSYTTIIQDFYTAFQNLDAEKMIAQYHDEIEFSDPAFGALKGDRAKGMWKMLLSRQKEKGFKVIFKDIRSDNTSGSAHWEAFYSFGPKKRKVHNIIKASFEFRDGKIIKHTDDFNTHAWAKQAMGFKGFLIGHTAFFKKKLQQQTNGLLDQYMATNTP